MPLSPPPSVSGCLQSGSDHSRLGHCQSALKWEEGGEVEMEGLESEQENVRMYCTVHVRGCQDAQLTVHSSEYEEDNLSITPYCRAHCSWSC